MASSCKEPHYVNEFREWLRDPPLEWILGWSKVMNTRLLFAMGLLSFFTGLENYWYRFGEDKTEIIIFSHWLATVVVWTAAVVTRSRHVAPVAFEACVLSAHALWGTILITLFFCVERDEVMLSGYATGFVKAPGGCVAVYLAIGQSLLILAGLRLVPSFFCVFIYSVCACTVILASLLQAPENHPMNWTGLLTVILWSVLFSIGLAGQHTRRKRIYYTEQELSIEKDATQSLITMICDASVWIAADCETIVRSHKHFDGLLGMEMVGQRITTYLEEPQVLQRALENASGSSRSSVQLIASTLLGQESQPLTRVEMFIVDRREAFASTASLESSAWSARSERLGFLLGVRLVDPDSSEPALAPLKESEVAAAVELSQRLRKKVTPSEATSVVTEGVDHLELAGARSQCSAVTAPAMLERSKLLEFVRTADQCSTGIGAADCLPPDATVWVEGKSTPASLGSIQIGQKVLCYDHVTGGLKFAEVMEAVKRGTDPEKDSSSNNVEWVAVTLLDGTRLEMTSDHPVFPKLAAAAAATGKKKVGNSMTAAVTARNLKPGSHSLEILKLVPVPIKEVKDLPLVSAGGRGPQRVTVSVQQPERHSLFVTQGSSELSGMAVASSCAAGVFTPIVKNTFIDLPSDVDHSRGRASSEPPNFHRTRRQIRIFDGVSDECTSEYAGTLISTSRSEVSPKSYGETKVYLATTWSKGADSHLDKLSGRASLTELMDLWNSGYQSFGSCGHAEGECLPCVMQYRHLREPLRANVAGVSRCRFGAFCSRCHESHSRSQLNIAQRRKGKTRRGITAEQQVD